MIKPRAFNRSFWLRVLLLFIIALIPLVLFLALTAPNSSDLQQIAQRTANELDRLLTLREQQVFTVAAFPSIRAYASSKGAARAARAAVALNELQSWSASDKNVREAFIVDKNGAVSLTTLDAEGIDFSARRFVQDALAGQLAASPVARDRGEFSNYYAAPILDNSGDIAGALVARVAAQELWSVLPHGANWYAVLSDENGVRLDDSGDPSRRLASFGGMDAVRATRILNEQTYGVELPQVRATQFNHAQQLLVQGALDQLRPTDFNADTFAAQRLTSAPWTVLVIAPQSTVPALAAQLVIPLIAALIVALIGALVLQRLA